MELLPSARSATSKRTFVQLLAPFAPHLAEELWHQLGEAFSVHTQPWPVADVAVLQASPVEIVVQIDGRRCGTIEAAQRSAQDAIVDLARERIAGVPADDHLHRVVFVPDRLLNFVTQRS
jgi:leucyl-tRNA synthetase